ncbi:glycosyl transferase family 90 [Sphingobacterium faecium]|uniref:glycosyl transferase family 90 n=1 Tax=Sphingobacterium faecium TaxID=34087 RepID=UPI003209E86C
MNTKRVLFKNKNFKFGYYLRAFFRELSFLPWYRYKRKMLNDDLVLSDQHLYARLNYYNQLDHDQKLGSAACRLKDLKRPDRGSVYYFDLKQYLRYFKNDLMIEMIPGDVVDVPEAPAIVKSRPIIADNNNSVLLNLDKVRHFNFINDEIPFRDKNNILLGRATVYQVHRKAFFQLFFDHPMCDLGDVAKKNKHTPWFKPMMSISEHLHYKFILALEGNDVATNLKWIMSSNSIAVMPTPKYETWFMEGLLLPDVHYIHIRDDYSDLEEKLSFYISHPEKAEEIVVSAHQFVDQFTNKNKEDLISIMVLDKFFKQTGQRSLL